ncbi:DNA-binding regulatory protein, YebC/PmpR family [Gottschalkia acidurici 9a]|uniref:Probable transcriptional regulatory protein Curi_c10440 n=1 Tax=Gottschalkia acidurici (strain ATCC 7906 / DSM 604 / BCRC 14475 / CIP 104303 / KCTC 5404 / NCIMB 10678 / 9a) TaxID=1128398 RepID=K0AVZ2_GOTA9|nr:YebC/PmpR family DNA-binding transcriptional regulator [Gottschalkia acidurici]AFS78058.1 DNA-binding regulatory protein, YebC/PmpR family [Gottschalkia acidurici 9a]
MAGHSKWNNIKNKKGKMDAQRGKMFTKLGRYITVAAREGGDDPEYNAALKSAIEKAKAENMPNDNIERAIKKGTGDLEGANYEEITYEGYGPSGVAVFVDCLTDNRNRTASDVRHAFDKFGGNLGSTGCVGWMFDRKGLLVIEKSDDIDEEELMMQSIEAGAEDFSPEDDVYEILTSVEDFSAVRDALQEAGYKFSSADLEYIPQNTSALEDEKDIKNMIKMLEMLEDNDDVQKVSHNWEIPDDLDI